MWRLLTVMAHITRSKSPPATAAVLAGVQVTVYCGIMVAVVCGATDLDAWVSR